MALHMRYNTWYSTFICRPLRKNGEWEQQQQQCFIGSNHYKTHLHDKGQTAVN